MTDMLVVFGYVVGAVIASCIFGICIGLLSPRTAPLRRSMRRCAQDADIRRIIHGRWE